MHLISAIFVEPTVLVGLQSAEAGRIACELIAVHEERNSDNFSYDLLIAGMALSKKDRSECKLSNCRSANFSFSRLSSSSVSSANVSRFRGCVRNFLEC